jgi:acetolactate synthase-1/2/3 large subunit
MFVADWVAEVFRNNSVERVFLYLGGTIAPLINACIKQDIQIECFKSEQGAGYAALAYARITGRPQVVMVTSGPGVTNHLKP